MAMGESQSAGDSQSGGGLRRWAKRGLFGCALLAAILIGLGLGLGLTGRALPVPQFAIATLETRLNRAVQASLPGAQLDIGKISLSLGHGLAPRLVLRDLALLNLAGRPVFALPEVQAVLAPAPLIKGQVILREARLSGAHVQVTRDANGQLDIAFAEGAGVDIAAIFALRDQFFASPLGAQLHLIEADALRLALMDARMGMTWVLGDGALRATRQGDVLAMDLGLTLMGGAQGADVAGLGRVDLGLTSTLGTTTATITAKVADVLSRDVAAQVPPLAFISVLDAPISGVISADVTPLGLGNMSARLDLGAGALAPTPQTQPVPFQSALVDLSYAPDKGRILLNDLRLVSETLDLRAGGHADMLRADGSLMQGPFAGEVPDTFIMQLRLDSLRAARAEVFAAPVTFTAGAADVRLRLAPFALDIGQFVLVDGDTRILAKGRIAAQDKGWQSSLDFDVNQISSAKLLGLWPKNVLPGTRKWLDSNLLAAQFSKVRLATRQKPGEKLVLDLGYTFDRMKMTAMRSLPAIIDGAGYGAISGRQFSMVLEAGRSAQALGGDLDLAGSVFTIPDMSVFPATGQITLESAGSLTATLSLIDQRPFQFLTKSNRKVDFAKGQARLTSRIALPLQKLITLPDITFQVAGTVTDFATGELVADRTIAAPRLDVFVDAKGLRISGPGQISGTPFDAAYIQDFGPENTGKARVEGTARLSDQTLRAFGVRLPDGMVTGEGRAEVAISLARGQPAQMVLTSDLNRIGLQIGPIGYAKPSRALGQLRAEIILSSPPQVTRLAIKAGDLQATGSVQLRADGTFDRARFADLTIGKWLAGDLVFVGQGAGRPIALQLASGTVDMRYLPQARGSSGSGAGGVSGAVPLSVRLDRLRVSDGIILTGFQGDFQASGGLKGNFAAQVAGGTPIQGQLTPSTHGTAVRVTAQDAGAALAQAGIYSAARGGALDLRLSPLAARGTYQGQAQISRFRVQNNSVLADMLNNISVVGLLDQLGGSGILFNEASGQFLLTPSGVELREGVATGASLGVTLQGVYRFAGRKVDMQGVISPVYLLNGVGAMISGRGEGVLGFNYTLGGTADAPRVGVNPLSVLLPGFFRNIFKAPPATLQGATP